VATFTHTLQEIQDVLFDRAVQLRDSNSVSINSLDDFRSFFTPQNAKRPEIHGGFATCHWTECPEMETLLKELKVTVRCVPLENNDEPGTCLFSGKPAKNRAIFAKAY